MAGNTIREALLRRRKWLSAIEWLWIALGLVVAISGFNATSLSTSTRFALLAMGALVYVTGLCSIPSRWLRCLRCDYPMGALGLRRRKTQQINVCPHCGLALDASLDEVRTP